MIESNMLAIECEYHRKHVPPWCYVSIRDINEPAVELEPGKTGGIAILDALNTAYPGFLCCPTTSAKWTTATAHAAAPDRPCGSVGVVKAPNSVAARSVSRNTSTPTRSWPSVSSPKPREGDHGAVQSYGCRPLQQPRNCGRLPAPTSLPSLEIRYAVTRSCSPQREVHEDAVDELC